MNIGTMALAYEGSTTEFDTILSYSNTVFTSIFMLEALLKIIACSFKIYIKNPWNKFDFIVVLSSVIDLITDAFGGTISFLRTGP